MVLIQLSQDYDYIAYLRCTLQPKYGYSEYLQWQNLRAEETLFYFHRSAKTIFNPEEDDQKKTNLFPSSKSAKLLDHLYVMDNYFFMLLAIVIPHLRLVENVKSCFLNPGKNF